LAPVPRFAPVPLVVPLAPEPEPPTPPDAVPLEPPVPPDAVPLEPDEVELADPPVPPEVVEPPVPPEVVEPPVPLDAPQAVPQVPPMQLMKAVNAASELQLEGGVADPAQVTQVESLLHATYSLQQELSMQVSHAGVPVGVWPAHWLPPLELVELVDVEPVEVDELVVPVVQSSMHLPVVAVELVAQHVEPVAQEMVAEHFGAPVGKLPDDPKHP
jgi:hypothetical protein